MQKLTLGLVILNVGLAAGFALSITHRWRTTVSPAASCETNCAAGNVSFNARLKLAPSIHSQNPDKMTWGSLASSDLHRYADNLRAVGCPEQTIKDILLAEVNRRYAIQERALKVRADDLAPWETPSSLNRRAGETKLRQLLEEKQALLKDLTGVDVGIDMPTRLAGRDVEKFEGAFSAVPEAKRDQVRAIQEKYWSQSDDIKQRTMGYLEPEDRDAFVQIKQERRDALAQVLTPRELQDYEMQTSETAQTMRSKLNGFTLSDDEFRKLFDYTQPLDEKYSLGRRNPDPVSTEFTAARTQAEQDVQSYLKSLVGDDRFAEYQRTQDPAYRNLSQAGADLGLSQEAILQTYQTQQQMQADSKRIAQEPNLTPEQRAQTLNDMQAQAQQRLQQILGDKAPQLMQRIGAGQMAVRYGLPMDAVPVVPNIPVSNPRPVP